MRQIPYAYHTKAYGPVYAFRLTDDGERVQCCTWDDYPVECWHHELLPFEPSALGADEILKLDCDIDIGGPTGKYPKPPEAKIGRWFTNAPIFFDTLMPICDRCGILKTTGHRCGQCGEDV